MLVILPHFPDRLFTRMSISIFDEHLSSIFSITFIRLTVPVNLANFDLSDDLSFCVAFFHLITLIGDKYLCLNEDDGSCQLAILMDSLVIFIFGGLDLNASICMVCIKPCHLISPQ